MPYPRIGTVFGTGWGDAKNGIFDWEFPSFLAPLFNPHTKFFFHSKPIVIDEDTSPLLHAPLLYSVFSNKFIDHEQQLDTALAGAGYSFIEHVCDHSAVGGTVFDQLSAIRDSPDHYL